jgi:hypothetical protein
MNVGRCCIIVAGAVLATAALVACGNGGASEPPVTSVDPAATSKLQFVVGVATIASNAGATIAYGLNVVETLRQKDGLSGTLYNVPMIVGPSSFNVLTSTQTGQPVLGAGSDVGTNHITWATLNQSLWVQPPRGIKQSTSGAFGYGLCACNSDSGPGNGVTPLYQSYNQPIYGNNDELWYGGPPAFPLEGPSLRALGWEGFALGFTDFAVAPVIGAYHLYAAVPPSYDTPQNPTPSPDPNGSPTPPPGILAASAQLTNLAPLPAFNPAVPAFHPDRKGGGTIDVTVPAGVREALAIVRAMGIPSSPSSNTCDLSHTTDSFYTIVTHKTGTQHLVLGDELGPLTQSGKKTPSICSGESYDVYAIGADWPVYESSYPQNLAQLPPITSPSGRADITTSDFAEESYP